MNSRKKKIIFIYEGIKAEQLHAQDKLLTAAVLSGATADGNIYMLWTRLKKDDFETNVIDVLKEMNPVAKERLNNLKSSDFSEIYLFFDYDGHNNNIPKEYLNKDILGEMLKTFNNETELGKLYVSYPMIESIKEIDIQAKDYKSLYLALDEISNYKHSFSSQSDFKNYNFLDKKHWLIACSASCKRASLLVKYNISCTYDYFIHKLNQENIYFYQKKNYINNGHLLCILNSVPLFLLEYFEEDFWNQATAS